MAAVTLHSFAPTATLPNSVLPLILTSSEFPAPDTEARVRGNGWQGTWTYTVYDYWHYHVTGHELLVCVAGEAELGFGGDAGLRLAFRPGDAAILPAGVGHRRFSASEDFAVVGAYPPGQTGAITRAGEMDLGVARESIAGIPLPDQDPLTGSRPGCLSAWHRIRS